MAPKRFLTAILLAATSSLATAQTADASQSSAVAAALSSYSSSLLHGPVATSLGIEVGLAVDATLLPIIESAIPTLLPQLTTNQDLYSFATNPPSPTNEPTWATQVPAGVRSDLEALRSSVYSAEASIVASVLGVTRAVQTSATPTSAGGAAGTSNAAVGRDLWSGLLMAGGVAAVGAAAVL